MMHRPLLMRFTAVVVILPSMLLSCLVMAHLVVAVIMREPTAINSPVFISDSG